MFNATLFFATLKLKNISIEKFAEIIGVKNKSTIYRKIDRNGDFTRSEIEASRAIFTFDEVMSIFFAEGVA